jgi:hypothetical protein
MLEFEVTKRTDERLLERMKIHYSKPKGFVGRSICYAILYNGIYYGHTVAGSATRYLQGRNEFLGISINQLNNIVNNIFFNISKIENKYPCRNFSTLVINEFVKRSKIDWSNKYGDEVIGFETLVEKPRTGGIYKRAGWRVVGETKGYTCKRVGGKGTDSWSGKRIWNTNKEFLRPKIILCYKVGQ